MNIQVAKSIIVIGEEHCFLAIEQLREVGIEMGAALFEPVRRPPDQRRQHSAGNHRGLIMQLPGEDDIVRFQEYYGRTQS